MSDVITGIIPVAPTVFAENEDLDLAGQARVVDFLVDARVDGICILANYSEQFSLDDSERAAILDTTMAAAAGRVPIMVTTSHYSARIARERCRAAEAAGAAIVMLMPPFFGATMSVGENDVLEYFKVVTDGLGIDVMIQDAPLSTTPVSASLIVRLAQEIPQVRYAKIETPRAANKIRTIAAAAPDFPGLFDGEESVTLIPDLHAGAVGTMSSSLVPEVLGDVVREFRSGLVEEATRRWETLLPLIHFENRQCGLAATKVLMKEGGVIASDRLRRPFPAVPDATRAELLAIARRHDPLVLSWGR